MTLWRWLRKLRERAGWILVLGLVVTLSGCAGSFEAARGPSLKIGASPPSARCMQLDDRQQFYGGSAKMAAVLSGGTGLATIATDDKTARLALAISAGVLGAVAAGAGFVQQGAATSWAAECK